MTEAVFSTIAFGVFFVCVFSAFCGMFLVMLGEQKLLTKKERRLRGIRRASRKRDAEVLKLEQIRDKIEDPKTLEVDRSLLTIYEGVQVDKVAEADAEVERLERIDEEYEIKRLTS